MKVRLYPNIDVNDKTLNFILDKDGNVSCLAAKYNLDDLDDKELAILYDFASKLNLALMQMWH